MSTVDKIEAGEGLRIGIDLGGTKIEGVVLDNHGETISRARVQAPRGDYGATLEALAALVAEIDPRPDLATPIGIGIPGTISPATGLVKNANSVWLIGHPLDRDLARLTGRAVRVANDANCFAISEAVDGAARGRHCVFGAILGTGCGAGIVIDRHILTGANAIAGEWGHTPLPWMKPDEFPGPECFCGRRGCLETFISGTGLERDYRAATGSGRPAYGIVAGAEAGEPDASAAFARYHDRLARALASVVTLIDPDVVVLGGGMSKVTSLYDTLPAAIEAHAFSDSIVTPVVPPVHGDAGGVRGAAWLWPLPGEEGPGEEGPGKEGSRG